LLAALPVALAGWPGRFSTSAHSGWQFRVVKVQHSISTSSKTHPGRSGVASIPKEPKARPQSRAQSPLRVQKDKTGLGLACRCVKFRKNLVPDFQISDFRFKTRCYIFQLTFDGADRVIFSESITVIKAINFVVKPRAGPDVI
jgi:hypothetical protein